MHDFYAKVDTPVLTCWVARQVKQDKFLGHASTQFIDFKLPLK